MKAGSASAAWVALSVVGAGVVAIVLVACGGAEGDPITVAALGDSITAGSPDWDPNPVFRRDFLGSEANERSQWEYWAARKNSRLDFRNCGVFGERTDEIARRLDRCAAGADVLVVQGGINDVAQRRPAREAAANLRTMVRRGRRLGLGVVLADVLPWNNGYVYGAPRIARLNRLIAEIGRSEDVQVLPFHDTLVDDGRPTHMREEWTSDGNHPSVEGYRRLGELAFRLP